MTLLLFKGIHLNVWHIENSERPAEDLSTFLGVCGRRMHSRFVDHYETVVLPPSLCAQCYRSTYFEDKPKPRRGPVALTFKAMKGVNESWRPDWNKKK